MIHVFQTKPNTVFKFRDCLCREDRSKFDKLYAQIAGKTIYIPKIKTRNTRYYARRNAYIKKVYS